jgi:predicted transcriptional regulator of viral defense system
VPSASRGAGRLTWPGRRGRLLGAEAAATALHGFRRLQFGDVVPEGVHLTVPRSSRGVHRPAGVFIHTVSEVLLPAEVQEIQGMKVTSAARSIADYELNAGRPDQVAMMLREAADRGLLLWSGITDVSPRRARALARVGLRA